MNARSRTLGTLRWISGLGLVANAIAHGFALAGRSLPESLGPVLMAAAALVYAAAFSLALDWRELAHGRVRSQQGVRPLPKWFAAARILATLYAVPWMFLGGLRTLAGLTAFAIALNLYAVGMLRMLIPSSGPSDSSRSEADS